VTKIDLEGIESRVLAFPVPAGRYRQIHGIKGKALFTSYPVTGTLGQSQRDEENSPKSRLEMYEFETQKKEAIVSEVDSFQIGSDRKTLIYRSGSKLRVMKAGEKSDEGKAKKGPGRESGWIDLGRIRVSVDRGLEWKQMYREAWRLQREHFWTPNMSSVDWELIYDRYEKLLSRVTTRSEFSDLIWEMQGELGTSHAYERGGDYRSGPRYAQGFLGADFEYDGDHDCYRIAHIVQGDVWKEGKDSPLNAPGINVKPGDKLIAIGGRKLSKSLTPNELLVNQAGREINLTFSTDDEENPVRTVCVKSLSDETPARYREWVQTNRAKVHEQTNGRVGYVHIPDMGAAGYAEFHRYYLAEVCHDALIVDVRCNSGGHVSQLILEKLARKRIGYDLPRWGEPMPYPNDSVLGPIVALNDEFAGSDGDIFSHCFKLMNLGVLVGKRTWGGVIGISSRYSLVDGSTTTQPEYSYWFKDVGWGVENYGTDPDVEVEIKPQDYAQGKDPQLDRAIEEVLKQLEENPPEKPGFNGRPDLSLPKLPPR
jgi:tricorn protease